MVGKHFSAAAYCLDLQGKSLNCLHDIFHASLMCLCFSNVLAGEVPHVKLDGELECKAATIKSHFVLYGEV